MPGKIAEEMLAVYISIADVGSFLRCRKRQVHRNRWILLAHNSHTARTRNNNIAVSLSHSPDRTWTTAIWVDDYCPCISLGRKLFIMSVAPAYEWWPRGTALAVCWRLPQTLDRGYCWDLCEWQQWKWHGLKLSMLRTANNYESRNVVYQSEGHPIWLIFCC
jgi:hypothetical protein